MLTDNQREKLPDTRESITHSFDIITADDTKSFYVTCGMYPDKRLGEIFVEHGMEGSFLGRSLDNMAMCISIGLQYGIPLDIYTRKLVGQRVEPSGIVEKIPEAMLPWLRERGLLGECPYYTTPSVFSYLALWIEHRFPHGYLRKEKQDDQG